MSPEFEPWPELDVASWQDTRDTVHMWTQIVGKVRMALSPHVNHWWNVTFYVDATGLTTSLMPYRTMGVEIRFDFVCHRLIVATTQGTSRELELRARTVASFHDELFEHLRALGIEVTIMGSPVEVDPAIPFAEDTVHSSYDADAMHRYWMSQHPGGVPNCPDWVMHEAYSDEVSSAGYWPGGASEGIFYSYAYPQPDGFDTATVEPEAAYFDTALGEFVLPYSVVRQSENPDATLRTFLDSTARVAAELAGWPTSDAEATQGRIEST